MASQQQIEAAAAAIANARAARRGSPAIANVLDVLKSFKTGELYEEVMEDPRVALEAAEGVG